MNSNYYCFPQRVNYIYTTHYLVMQITEDKANLWIIGEFDRIDSAISYMDNLPANETHRSVLYEWRPEVNMYVYVPLVRIVPN